MNIILLQLLAVFALALLPCASAGCEDDSAEYGCGVDYYEYGYFTTNPDTTDCCCCRRTVYGGIHGNTCDGNNGNPFRSWPKGCGACMGDHACWNALNSKIGDESCVGEDVCKEMENSKIKQRSCRGDEACKNVKDSNVGLRSCSDGKNACEDVEDSNVGTDSCDGKDACRYMDFSNVGSISCLGDSACYDASNTQISGRSCLGVAACYKVEDSQIGERSCQAEESCRRVRESSTVGNDSCQRDRSCKQSHCEYFMGDGPLNCLDYGRRLTIGKNSCNYENVCRMCENDSVVPDNACNELTWVDMSWEYTDFLGHWAHLLTCNYCRSQYRSLSTDAGFSSSRRRLTEVDLNISCNDLADTLKNYIIEHVEAHAMFKNFVHEVITDHCNSDKKPSNLVEFIPDEDNGRCTVKIDFVMKTRLKNGDETPLVDRIQEKVNEFCASESLEEFGFSCNSIEVTDQVIEKDCSKAAGSGSESSKGSSTNEGGAKAGKDGKSSQAEAMVERHRIREHKSGKGKNGK